MTWPEGVGRIIVGTLGSTSEEARLRAPAEAPVWVMAHRQTAGRGRRGRPWAAPAGNFTASLAWRPEGAVADYALRSFTACLALVDALEALGVQGLMLKWPNDVLKDGGKLAGILLESPDPGLLILGVGVNLAASPDPTDLEVGAVRPAKLDGGILPETLLDTLAPAFAAREAELLRDGFAPIRTAWRARAAGLGQIITARMATQTHTGRFEDIDADGQLVIVTETGRRVLPAADIYFGGPPCS